MAQPEPGNSPPQIANSAAVHYYLRTDQTGPVTLEIQEAFGDEVHTATVPGTAGIHRYYWNLRFGAAEEEGGRGGGRAGRGGGRGGRAGGRGGRGGGDAAAGPGTYIVRITVGGTTQSSVLTIRDDPDAPR
jgi:hypothetical protein